MATTLIKLVYKQVIDASATGEFEKRVFNASYDEWLLKSQAYNPEGKFKTFSELKAHDGRANSLHYKLSFAVGHYIERLKNTIPHLTDKLGNPVKFDFPKFELIESHVADQNAHKVAINYITGSLVLCHIIGDHLLLAKHNAAANDALETFMIKLEPNLSIIGYQMMDDIMATPTPSTAL